jgi:hypothetical protein
MLISETLRNPKLSVKRAKGMQVLGSQRLSSFKAKRHPIKGGRETVQPER